MKNITNTDKQANLYEKTFVLSIIFLIIIKEILLLNGDIIVGDIFMAFMIIIITSINSYIPTKAVRMTINIATMILIGIFLLDIILLYGLQSRLSVFEMYQFFKNMHSVFFDMYMILGVLGYFLFLGINLIITKKIINKKICTKKYIKKIAFGISIIGAFSILATTRENTENTKLQLDIIRYNISFFQDKNNFLQNTEVGTGEVSRGKQYKDFFSLQKGAGKKPNIILVYAESFSAVDSKRVEGLYDNLPLFDKIQEQGITYTNFLANGCTSETTHIATLQGVEPREHPSMTKDNAYSEYASLNTPLPKFFENNGYKTTFLSTVTLDFLNQKQFLKDMGFTTIIGDEAFKKEKTYTFGAAPDEALYTKAIEIMKQQSSPYFLTMQTISSHEPYETPDGNGEKTALGYVDKSIYKFYQDLQTANFFENGILIILADHRKIDTATPLEKEKYKKTTPSRVLGTIIGQGIPKGVLYDMPIQHIDFYYSIKKLVGKTSILTRDKYNDAFTNTKNRDRTIRYCRYFLNDNGYVIMEGEDKGYSIESGEKYIKDYINAYKIFQYNNRKSRTKNAKNYLSGNFTEKLLKTIY